MRIGERQLTFLRPYNTVRQTGYRISRRTTFVLPICIRTVLFSHPCILFQVLDTDLAPLAPTLYIHPLTPHGCICHVYCTLQSQ
jgi:hypothetical protein